MKIQLIQEAKRLQKLAGILTEEKELDDKQLANKYYNKWLEDPASSSGFGDSTTFSGANDDIINGDYEDADDYSGAVGFDVSEVASVYITNNKNLANTIKNDFENNRIYQEGSKYIIIVW